MNARPFSVRQTILALASSGDGFVTIMPSRSMRMSMLLIVAFVTPIFAAISDGAMPCGFWCRTMSRQNFPSDRWYSFCRTSRMLAWTSSLACLISSIAMTAAGLISGTVFLCASSSSQLGMSSRFMILLHLVSLLTNSIELMHTNVKKSCCASSNSFLPRFMISFSSGPAVRR